MMKKLLSIICCLAPFSAGAVVYPNGYTPNFNPGTGNAVGGDGGMTGLDTTGENVVIQSGNGIVLNRDSATGTSQGLTVANNMYIGRDSQGGTTGDLYAETGVDSVFTISSDGNVSVASLLQVLNGYTLGIKAQTAGTTIDASFGNIIADGGFVAENINNFTVNDAIESAADLKISANVINTGAINSTGGDTNIAATGKITMAQLSNNGGGNATINAAEIESGNIENLAGAMNITLGGDLTSTGSIENSGTAMTIGRQNPADVVNVSVAGTIKNDSNAGTMTMNVDSLTVSGGDASNPSFVNKGNLNLTVRGETNLAFGFDLSAMQNTNTFSLDTGTLVFGAGTNNDAWLQVFSNDLNSFNLAVRQGNIDARQIVNGTTNANANMTLLGQSITATSVENRGNKLTMNATDAAGTGIVVSGAVSNAAASDTEIISAGALNVQGNVSNAGTMVLNGNTVELAGVVNTGDSLEITAPTDTTGRITISGNISNSNGNLLVNAREISATGILTNNSGTTTIRGSDTAGSTVSLGGVNVDGGTVNLNALVGGATITNGLSVTGGALNIDGTTYALTAGDSIQINGNFTASGVAALGAGNVNVAVSGPRGFIMKSNTGAITIDGDVSATDNASARSAQFDAATIEIGQNVLAENKGTLIFGGTTSDKLSVAGSVSANNGGTVEIYSDDADVGSLSGNGAFIAHGTQITATTGAIDIQNGVWFDGTSQTTGLIVRDTNDLTLKTAAAGQDINLAGGITIGAGNRLGVDSANAVAISGLVNTAGTLDVDAITTATFNNAITNGGTLTVNAQTIDAQDITNTATANLTATGDITTNNITNSSDFTINGATIIAGAVDSTAGILDITGNSLNVAYLTITGGNANVAAATITATNDISVSGDLMQGSGSTGMLNITENNAVVSAKNLTVGGNFAANGNSVDYRITNNATITGNINVATGADADLSAQTIAASDLTNAGTLKLAATNGITLGAVVNNAGTLTLDSGAANSNVASFTMNGGNAALSGIGMVSGGVFTTGGMLYQNYNGALGTGDVNVVANNYAINTTNVNVHGITQNSGAMVLNTSDITVGADINATNLRIAANPSNDWLNVNVAGNVSGGVGFIGLEQMTIGGNYVFNDGSKINAAILPYATNVGPNNTTRNYWSTVSLADDNTLGQITNAADGQALITVGDKFVTNVSNLGNGSNGGPLKDAQIGIDLRDIVDQGTAIWFLHANNGMDELATKIRNLNVNFCNADGSLCFNYLDSLKPTNGTDTDLPAYLSMRDTDGDGIPDSIYIVFDPRFGGPVEVFKIQPIVERTQPHTNGEYVSAGALDNMIAGQLQNTGFYNRTPIEAIPLIFKGTNLETMANELYKRMEYYDLQRDGTGLARFSRLFQVREIEQIAGSVSLNEHTNFRSFEDRMFDEFIWNRNRNLKKAWADFDFGMFTQDVADGKRVDGNRFSVSGGFDWQHSETLILGLTGRVSHMSGKNDDTMELGYQPGQSIIGNVNVDVADTNIGLGGYLMKTLGEKTRVYGNAFLDMHLLDVSRDQNFVASIDGTGTAFSIMSEWGLLHDWLNQYIVGNMYARVGYNFGFSVKEKAAGHNYMDLKSDGYLVFTPGYSLTAQKRIYPSAWMQIRPYATIGIEYDVLGMPDSAKYKFAPAHSYTKYDIDIDPMWANIGGGVEVLSARGYQVGLDYRYQYNSQIQLHNIKISGSYRF